MVTSRLRSFPYAFLLILFSTLILIVPCFSYGAEDNLEKDLQKSLEQSRTVIAEIQRKLQDGKTAATEFSRLKSIVENIKVANLLLEERFRLREEKVKGQGSKAIERHQAMKEGYQAALTEYLAAADSLIASTQKSDQLARISKLRKILDKVLPKKKKQIIGSLPYKHLNYPAKEPVISPEITPAYKGGNKTVSPEDTGSTPEAPVSKEIAALAQSLNWNPVSMYEYVKNNVETEWYWGCMKGAEETLHQKSGNDCDQATLLAALLRASGFPTRYVRGAIEFFPDIEKVKNLTGISDPWKIAEFFQKAGIPYKPVIAGGRIANFQVEHIWVESQIPYANYRGAIIDEHGKTWLGLDTSTKVKDYVYNNPKDIFQEQELSSLLTGLREEYLSGVQTLTPIEFLNDRIDNSALRIPHSEFLLARSLPQEHMNILPAGMQFKEVAVTSEFTTIPDELKHKVRFTATSAQNAELLNIELDLMKLSNQQVVVSYEPETVEDQEIINSYGGLDNTPAYLVRLRPMIKINGERIVVGQDGLPMGSEYDLKIELISPNGTETITNSMITGNLSVIGITSQRAMSQELSATSQDKNAEQLMFETAQHYIDRWNKSEDELASLFHLSFTRPLPTVVTLGGMIEVTYLLDVPHGFSWKGVYVDADHRTVEAVRSKAEGVTGEAEKTFMQLSSLQGSILENRIFEDDFKVESISTAKLLQIVNSQTSTGIITIDKSNIDSLLPSLPFDDDIKEDMINAVNQGFQLKTPNSEQIYEDWTGVGYIKENVETGESGWMLSGMIAGGMTAIKKQDWIDQDKATILELPNTLPPNPDPNGVARLVRYSDYETGFAGSLLAKPCQVRAEDAAGRPVQNVKVTFSVTSGGGKIQGVDKTGNFIPDLKTGSNLPATDYTIKTGSDGIARVKLTLGEKIDASPMYRQEVSVSNKQYWELLGLNMVSMSAPGSESTIYTDKPFEAYARAGVATKIEIVSPKTTVYGIPNTLASSAWIKVMDQYGNSISGKNVKFYVERTFKGPDPGPAAKTARLYSSVKDCPGTATLDCKFAKEYTLDQPLVQFAEHFGAMAYVIMGNTANTRFTVKALAMNDNFNSEGKRVDSDVPLTTADMVYETSAKADNKAEFALAALGLYQFDEAGNMTDAGLAGQKFSENLSVEVFYHKEAYEPATDTSGNYYLKGSGVFSVAKVIDGQVEFKPTWGGGLVSAPVATIDGKGFYSTQLTLGQEPALNTIQAIGSVELEVPTINSTTGEVTTPKTTLKAGTVFNIWGVKPSVVPNQLVLINTEGYPVNDTEILFSILPAQYKYSTKSLYLDFYEKDTQNNESWMGFVQADPTGKIIISRGGIKFNPSYTYSVQLIVDRGTKKEVASGKVAINSATLYIEKKDPEFPDVKLRWDDYYPALGSKTIKLRSSLSLNGKVVRCEVVEPTAETVDNIGTMTLPTCSSDSPQLVNNAVKFKLAGLDLVPMINDDPTTGVNSIKLRFSIENNTTASTIEAVYNIKNNSNTTFKEVMTGEAVFSADRENIVSMSTGTTPSTQGFDYVQELLNQVVSRARQTYDDATQQWVSNRYALLGINGIYSDASYIAVRHFKRSFGLSADTSDTYRKIKKDYGFSATDTDNWWWFDKIIEKEALVGKVQRIPADSEQVTLMNADVALNSNSDNIHKDTGLFELYKNVVERFVNNMIAEGDRYRLSRGSNYLPLQANTYWMSRTGEAITESESYCFGCKDRYEDFWRTVSRRRACNPSVTDSHPTCSVTYNSTGCDLVNLGYVGTVDDNTGAYTGSKQYSGLKQAEFDLFRDTPNIVDCSGDDRFDPLNWAGIDCAGFIQRIANFAEYDQGMTGEEWSVYTRIGDIRASLDRAITAQNFFDEDRVTYLENPDLQANQAILQRKIRKGDLVRYGNTHMSIIYSNAPICNNNLCEYEILHASGYNQVCYQPTVGSSQACRFNRKVVRNEINIQLQSDTLKNPTGFGRIKLWD